ncbi:hypothetical protein [Methanosarcina horonobensis]|uniref:hypothetical protein n=1 Tax=Methanosarcina horonobensis TaxID=418008 RepID=UPI000AB10131|nr:hypothetical protein [Methanosarcina horonobensis]
MENSSGNLLIFENKIGFGMSSTTTHKEPLQWIEISFLVTFYPRHEQDLHILVLKESISTHPNQNYQPHRPSVLKSKVKLKIK